MGNTTVIIKSFEETVIQVTDFINTIIQVTPFQDVIVVVPGASVSLFSDSDGFDYDLDLSV